MELSSRAREGWKDRRIGGWCDRQMWETMRAQSNLSREDRQLSDGWKGNVSTNQHILSWKCRLMAAHGWVL